MSDQGTTAAGESVRIDRWLLAARVYKTRSLCSAACDGGKVEVNGTSATPHRLVHVGDHVHATTRAGLRQLIVRGLGLRRLSAPEARELYEDVSPPPPPEEIAHPRMAPPEMREAGSGRPTKRDRRAMQRMRRG